MATPPTRAWRSPTRVWWVPLAAASAVVLVGCSGGTTTGRPVALSLPTAYTAQPGAAGQQTPARQAGVDDSPSDTPPPASSTAPVPTTDSPTSDTSAPDSPTTDTPTTPDPAPPNTATAAPPPAPRPGPLPPQSSYMQSLCQGYRETVEEEGVEATIRQVETTNPMWPVLSPNDKAITLEAIRMAGHGCH